MNTELPVLSKVSERLVYNRLLKFIGKYKFLYLYQFGFRQKHFPFMSLSSFIDRITEYTKNGEYSIGLLDFSKAFDIINHDILFMKLHHCGIRGVSLLWFKSSISNRLQHVSYNHCNSTLRKINCGVPQGSVLWPVLFLLYINDLVMYQMVYQHLCLLMIDTSILGHDRDISSLQSHINDNLEIVSQWLQVNKLSLKVLKYHYMLFTRKGSIPDDIEIKINNVNISRV